MHCIQFIVFSFCINIYYLYILLWYYQGELLSYFGKEISEEYDYIIVGSGTAGSLIAHRMIMETNFTFVILEAGGHGNPIFSMPVLGPLLHGSKFDWGYETVTQSDACRAMKNAKCQLPQGRMVGGSSKINNMVHVRGNYTQYVDWFHHKYSLHYMEQQLNYIEKEILKLDKLRHESRLANAVLDAAKELGYKTVEKDKDINDFSINFHKVKVTQNNGERWDVSDLIADKNNLVTNALVNKILINSDNVAYGVNFVKSGVSYNVKAKKAVILSAGAFNSPKILQLSGIGPKSILEELGIEVKKDLPVGENLQDHITTGFDLIHFNDTLDMSASDMLNIFNLLDYIVNDSGPFTSPGCEVVGFVSTCNNSVPDIQFMVLPVGITSDRGSHLRNVLGLKDEVWTNYFEKSFNKQTATILPILLNPKSRGHVKITSKDPSKHPAIDPKYLSSKEDLIIMVEGLKLIAKFVETKALKTLGAHLNPLPFPGCETFKLYSDEYWQCYVSELTLTSYHPVGTCSMGLPGSEKTVVDTSFRVIGVDNLFVVDGSVLPSLPLCNINAAIALMANIFFDNEIKNKLNVKCFSKRIDLFVNVYNKVCVNNVNC